MPLPFAALLGSALVRDHVGCAGERFREPAAARELSPDSPSHFKPLQNHAKELFWRQVLHFFINESKAIPD